jgi:hypothetical protein
MAEVRAIAVGGQRLRVAITSGPNGPGRPTGYYYQLTEAAGLAPVVDGFLSGP